MPCTDRDAPSRGERGSALLLVAVLGFLTMALWATAYRATHDSIRGEAFAVKRAERGFTVAEAAARGVALLRTGEPPSQRYACVVTIRYEDEDHACVVSYTPSAGQDTWLVEARPALDGEIRALPDMPITFSIASHLASSPAGSRHSKSGDRSEDRSHADR